MSCAPSGCARRGLPSVLGPSIVASLVLAAGCAGPKGAIEDEPARIEAEHVSPALEAKMRAVTSAIEQRGFAPTGEPARAFLVESGSLVEEVTLASGRCQVFVALGSQALREIALGVYDSGGTELAAARAAGPSVALRHCADLPGTHYVAVEAVAGDGLVTARRFEGPSGIAIDLEELFAGSSDEGEAAGP